MKAMLATPFYIGPPPHPIDDRFDHSLTPNPDPAVDYGGPWLAVRPFARWGHRYVRAGELVELTDAEARQLLPRGVLGAWRAEPFQEVAR